MTMAIAKASMTNGKTKAANKAATKTAKGKEVKTIGKAATIKLTPKPQPKPRKGFYLMEDDVAKYKAEFKESKTIPIPHHAGNYRAIVQALINLGKDKAHLFKAFKSEVIRVMSDAETKDDENKTLWQRFKGKDAKSDDNAKSLDDKIVQNCEVLQRLGGETPYGLRLMQIGQLVLKTRGLCIDILKAKGDEWAVRLNTNSAKPQHDFKRSRA